MSANRRPGQGFGRWALGAAVVVGLLVGLIGGVIIAKCSLDWFSPTVTLGQVIQSGILLVVFLLANHYYAKTHDARKKQAEIRADLAGDVADAVKDVHTTFAEFASLGEIPEELNIKLARSLREYSNAIGMLDVAVKDLDRVVSPSFEELFLDRQNYKAMLTGAPYPTKIPMERFVEESKMYRNIQSNLLLFRLALAKT